MIDGLPMDMHKRLLCPICRPDEPDEDRALRIEWSTSLDLYADFAARPDGAPVGPGDAQSATWQIACGVGHVLAKPTGDDVANENTDLIKPRDWNALLTVLRRLDEAQLPIPPEPGYVAFEVEVIPHDWANDGTAWQRGFVPAVDAAQALREYADQCERYWSHGVASLRAPSQDPSVLRGGPDA